jgi:hypothetical protein
MTQQWTVPAWLALATVVVLVLLVVLASVGLVLGRRRSQRIAGLLTSCTAESEALRVRVDLLERRSVASRPLTPREERDYVVTLLGDVQAGPDAVDPAPREQAPVVPPAVFADIVLRETVVQSASLFHGLRRAFSPEVRNRIRFEMGREVKRSRKERRAESREALRQWQAQQRRVHQGSAGEPAA